MCHAIDLRTLAFLYTMSGREHVGLTPTRQALLAPSAKRREVLGESREGRAASYQQPILRWTFLHNIAYG